MKSSRLSQCRRRAFTMLPSHPISLARFGMQLLTGYAIASARCAITVSTETQVISSHTFPSSKQQDTSLVRSHTWSLALLSFTFPKASETTNIPPKELPNVLQIIVEICLCISPLSMLLRSRRWTAKSINSISRSIDQHVAQPCRIKPSAGQAWCAHSTHHTAHVTSNTAGRRWRLELYRRKEGRVLDESGVRG